MFQNSWKESFTRMKCTVMYVGGCPALADERSSLYIGCASGGKLNQLKEIRPKIQPIEFLF